MRATKRVLLIVHHRANRSPGQRFRFEQYLELLEAEGYQFVWSPLMSAWADRTYYAKGKYLGKVWVLLIGFIKRLRDLFRARRFDVIYVFREAYFTGTSFFERRLAASGRPVIFDFDDAIFLEHITAETKKYRWLKNPKKTDRIVRGASLVTVGNDYLAEYARKFNENVVVIPTTVDTEYHMPGPLHSPNEPVCIGWTGSFSTLANIESLLEPLSQLKTELGDRIHFQIIADRERYYPQIDTHTVLWSPDREISDLQEMDLGLMPLPDDSWTRGKCGFKAIQYMALGIPAIVSPIGVNKEIITHGTEGFWAQNDLEWQSLIRTLVLDSSTRVRMGAAGRQKAIEYYSVKANTEKYRKAFASCFTVEP